MAGQPQDACDWVLNDMDFRFRGAGVHNGHFYTSFWLDENQCFHREDGPAYTDGEGTKVWFRHGLRHRDGDEPAYSDKEGNVVWYKDGKIHREGAPAVTYADGTQEWWMEGMKLTDDEVKQYKMDVLKDKTLLKEHWLTVAKKIALEVHGGTQRDIRAVKMPKFLT
jgi:hypothetical protein